MKEYQEIDLLKSTVMEVRMNINEYHRSWFEEATKLAGVVDSSPAMPRICECQMMPDNQPANDPETSQLLDHLINQLLLRFDTGQLSIVKGFTIIPTLMQERVMKQGRASWNTDFMEFAENYREDFPELESFKSEMNIWEVYWLPKFDGKLPDRISSTLKEIVTMKDTFPNIYCALCILGTVEVALYLRSDA